MILVKYILVFRLVHVDDSPSGAGEGSMDQRVLSRGTHDEITCIQASDRLLIVVSAITEHTTSTQPGQEMEGDWKPFRYPTAHLTPVTSSPL